MAALYPDTLLTVDLSTQTIDDEAVPDTWIHDFIGGKGIGARYLYDAVGPGVDPLSAENVLLFLIGPLSGYLPGDARFCAITKSPLTGLFLDSYAGGTFVPSFRTTYPSYLGIVIEGGTRNCCILDLRDNEPTLLETPSLVDAPIDAVDAEYPDASVVAVGPAGEAGVPFASIGVDGGAHHAGRGGAGAVMGTKGLKAILLDQTDQIDPPTTELQSLKSSLETDITESPYGDSYRTSGTMETIDIANELSILPTRGWQRRVFDQTAAIGVDAVRAGANGRERPDDPLPGDFRIGTDPMETVLRGGTPIALGSTLGIGEFDAVAELGAACDRLGLDVISAGNAISLAIIASNQGRIDRELTFGEQGPLLELVDEIAHQSTPLGRILAGGVERAAMELELDDLIPTVKAMAVPSFDPRGAPALALAYATSDRGACHRRAVPITAELYTSRWTPTQTAKLTVAEQDRRALLWSLIVDDVMIPGLGDIGVEWLEAIGLTYSPDELSRVGQRTWTMTRLFNAREGVTKPDDSVPALFTTSDSRLDAATFDRMRRRYYEWREWDRNGIPSRRLVDRLDLLSIVDDATPLGDPPLHS